MAALDPYHRLLGLEKQHASPGAIDAARQAAQRFFISKGFNPSYMGGKNPVYANVFGNNFSSSGDGIGQYFKKDASFQNWYSSNHGGTQYGQVQPNNPNVPQNPVGPTGNGGGNPPTVNVGGNGGTGGVVNPNANNNGNTDLPPGDPGVGNNGNTGGNQNPSNFQGNVDTTQTSFNKINTGNDPAVQMYNNIYDKAVNGTIQDFNSAAGRLRERTAAATQGAVDAAGQKNLSRGFGASGQNEADQWAAKSAGISAYGQGLVGLEDDFEKNRLQGLGIGNNSSQGVANVDKNYADDQLSRETNAGTNLTSRQNNGDTNAANIQVGRYSSDTQGMGQLMNMIQALLRGGGQSQG